MDLIMNVIDHEVFLGSILSLRYLRVKISPNFQFSGKKTMDYNGKWAGLFNMGKKA